MHYATWENRENKNDDVICFFANNIKPKRRKIITVRVVRQTG